jgi:hypothetical protein
MYVLDIIPDMLLNVILDTVPNIHPDFIYDMKMDSICYRILGAVLNVTPHITQDLIPDTGSYFIHIHSIRARIWGRTLCAMSFHTLFIILSETLSSTLLHTLLQTLLQTLS